MKLLSDLPKMLPGILLVLGLILINVPIYFMFDEYIGMIATGVTLILVAVVISYEYSGR